MNELQTIENIKHCIATGKTKRAVDDLILMTQKVCIDLNDPALMLKNRMATLEREIVEGVVSHADQKMEEARIARALLVLVSNIEEECLPQVLASQKAEWQQKEADLLQKEAENQKTEAESNLEAGHKREIDRQNEPKQPKNESKTLSNGRLKWIFMVVIFGLIAFSVFYFNKKEPSLVMPQPPKTIAFEGQVQFPDKKLVPFADVELTYQNQTFNATADNKGHFKIELPEKTIGEIMNLTIKYKGKAVISENIKTIEANLKSPTIPFE